MNAGIVSGDWAVHVQGMDDVLPALNRADALMRAHQVNSTQLWLDGRGSAESGYMLRPVAWAVPIQSDVIAGYTTDQVEQAWKEWES
ncbi:hypothetical protein [Nocardia niwae]|uniref:hypothetical protein n=1 Tax=Nocardia niwae TaxID=626084 RepID=UPI0007A44F8D|nr:hypothetical protein [Nocardia niwae]